MQNDIIYGYDDRARRYYAQHVATGAELYDRKEEQAQRQRLACEAVRLFLDGERTPGEEDEAQRQLIQRCRGDNDIARTYLMRAMRWLKRLQKGTS